MMRGPKNTAMAVRTPEGKIEVENVSCPLPSERPWIFKIPLLRLKDAHAFGGACRSG